MRYKGAISPVLAAISILIAIAGRGNCVIVSIAIVALVLCIIAAIAPFTPLLRKFPIIGEHKLKAIFTLDPGHDLKVSVRPVKKSKVTLRVGIKNPHRQNIKNAVFTLLLPASIAKCEALDRHGNPNGNEGVWSTTREQDSDLVYWVKTDLVFIGRSSALLHFELTFIEPGNYGPIYCKITSSDLAHEFISQIEAIECTEDHT